MPVSRVEPDRPSSNGWAIASLVGVLGVALASKYLFPRELEPSDGPQRFPSGDMRAEHPHTLRSSAGSEAGEADDRGRSAATPSAIPAHGWKDILLRVYANFSEHRIMSLAAGMTYYSILAIFPAIAALVAINGFFADPSSIAEHLDQLGGVLPGGALDVARNQLTRVASNGSKTLGLAFLLGFCISLWSANAAMKALFDTLNIVYGEDEKRGFFKLNAISLCFTIAAILFVVAALGSVVAVPVILNSVGLSKAGDYILRFGRWPAMYLVITFALAIIYRYGASRETPQWRWITWGSAIAALLWLGGSALFSWYAANFGKFNETYGSLGAIIGFMTWLWISAIVILLGAEIDAEMEHQTAHDTTEGAPKPMGKRGAHVADSVATAQGG